MEIMQKIESARGALVHIETPMSMASLEKSSYELDYGRGYEYTQLLRVGTTTVVRHDATNEEKKIINHRAMQMMCEEIYGEAAKDLYVIMLYCYEKHGHDRALMNYIDALMQKLRP
jgi:hypothetical protein